MTDATKLVTSLALTQMKVFLVLSVRLTDMGLTNVAAATVEALVDVDSLVGRIQIKLRLVPSVSICLLHLRQHQCFRLLLHQATPQLLLIPQPHHQPRRQRLQHFSAASVKPMDLERTSAVVDTAGALVGAGSLAEKIQTKLRLVPNV